MVKYSNPKEKFEFSERMSKVHVEILPRVHHFHTREDTFTSPADAGDKNPFVDVFAEMPDAPYIIALAHAIVRSWMVTPFMIFKDEAIVGITRPTYPVYEHFSEGLRYVSQNVKDETLRDRMEPLKWSHLFDAPVQLFGRKAADAISDDALWWAGGFQGHTICNYYTLLDNGLDGMIAKIDRCEAECENKDEKTKNFYEACRIIIRGMSQYLEGYSAEAKRLAESEEHPAQKKYYEDISANCAFVAHSKPETLYQATQLMWTLCLWDWVDCVGRADQYFYPYYEKAVREGDVIPAEESITSIMLKMWENGVHNITVSGVDKDGNDVTNELTFLMLQILRRIHDVHPRMSIRLHKDSPSELLELATTMWSEGMCDPSVVSDETVIPGLIAIGTPLEDARDFSMLGCQEIEIPGQSNFGCEDGVFNMAKVLEYTLHNGMSVKHPGVRVGLETGEFKDFETFEDFYSAYKAQIEYFTEKFLYICNRGQELRAANVAKLVKSPFTTGCLEKGKASDEGGPVYNYGVVETCGFAATADSLTAIKKLVFEEKKISKEKLIAALDANFEGYEKERQLLLNSAPKFGNDNPEADEMAASVLDHFWSYIGKFKSVRGDVFTGACSLLEGGIHYGAGMYAMADGRFAGEPLGNSIGPRPGADKNGITPMLSSVAKLPLGKGVGGTTLNVVLSAKMLGNEEMRLNISSVMKAYLMNGGQMAQITTANLEDLKDAQVHPERHGNLIIRIGGFSIQFVQLEKASQDEVISRYA